MTIIVWLSFGILVKRVYDLHLPIQVPSKVVDFALATMVPLVLNLGISLFNPGFVAQVTLWNTCTAIVGAYAALGLYRIFYPPLKQGQAN